MRLEYQSRESIKQQHALTTILSMRYRVWEDSAFLPLLPPFFFLWSLPSLCAHRPVCLVLDFLCFLQNLPCPEGIDLQGCFDPVVMILLFAWATSFSPLRSPHKMLWIRPEDGMLGEETRLGEEQRGEWCSGRLPEVLNVTLNGKARSWPIRYKGSSHLKIILPGFTKFLYIL